MTLSQNPKSDELKKKNRAWATDFFEHSQDAKMQKGLSLEKKKPIKIAKIGKIATLASMKTSEAKFQKGTAKIYTKVDTRKNIKNNELNTKP